MSKENFYFEENAKDLSQKERELAQLRNDIESVNNLLSSLMHKPSLASGFVEESRAKLRQMQEREKMLEDWIEDYRRMVDGRLAQ